MRNEIALAKSELRVSVKAGGTGAGLFAVAAFLAILALIMLSVGFAYLIHWNGQGLSLHWAFLIVAGAYFLLAALLGFLGYRKVRQVKAPERAIYQAQEAAERAQALLSGRPGSGVRRLSAPRRPAWTRRHCW